MLRWSRCTKSPLSCPDWANCADTCSSCSGVTNIRLDINTDAPSVSPPCFFRQSTNKFQFHKLLNRSTKRITTFFNFSRYTGKGQSSEGFIFIRSRSSKKALTSSFPMRKQPSHPRLKPSHEIIPGYGAHYIPSPLKQLPFSCTLETIHLSERGYSL